MLSKIASLGATVALATALRNKGAAQQADLASAMTTAADQAAAAQDAADQAEAAKKTQIDQDNYDASQQDGGNAGDQPPDEDHKCTGGFQNHQMWEADLPDGKVTIECYGPHMVSENDATETAKGVFAELDGNGDELIAPDEVPQEFWEVFEMCDLDGGMAVTFGELQACVFERQLYVVPTDDDGQHHRVIGELEENGGEPQDRSYYENMAQNHIRGAEDAYYRTDTHDGQLQDFEVPEPYQRTAMWADENDDGVTSAEELGNWYEKWNVHDQDHAHNQDHGHDGDGDQDHQDQNDRQDAQGCSCFSNVGTAAAEQQCEGNGWSAPDCVAQELCHWGPTEIEQCSAEANSLAAEAGK